MKSTPEALDDVMNYCKFIELHDPFFMKIIHYAYCENAYYNRYYCASSCTGVTRDNDTIRVLSTFNTDSTFKVGELVKVIPESKPSSQVRIAQYYVKKNNGLYLTDIQKKNLKTIFGNLNRVTK